MSNNIEGKVVVISQPEEMDVNEVLFRPMRQEF